MRYTHNNENNDSNNSIHYKIHIHRPITWKAQENTYHKNDKREYFQSWIHFMNFRIIWDVAANSHIIHIYYPLSLFHQLMFEYS